MKRLFFLAILMAVLRPGLAAARDPGVFPGSGWNPVEFGEPSTNLVGVRANLDALGAWNQSAWETAEAAARTPSAPPPEPAALPAADHADRWLEIALASDMPTNGLFARLPAASRERFRLLLRLLPEESEWPRVRAALDEAPVPPAGAPVRDALRLVLAVLAADAPATEAALARFPVVLEEHSERKTPPVPDIEAFLAIPEEEALRRMNAADAAFRAEAANGGSGWSTNREAVWWSGAVGSWLEREREAALDRDDLPLALRIEDRRLRVPRRSDGGPFPDLSATPARADFLETRILPGRNGSGHDLPYWESFADVCFELGQWSRPLETLDRLLSDPATDAGRLRKDQIRALVECRRAARSAASFADRSRAFAAYQDAKTAADATDAFWGYDHFDRVFVEWCAAAEGEMRRDPGSRAAVLAMRPRCRAALAGRILGPESFESDRHLALAYVGVLDEAGALDEAERLLWDSIGRGPSAWHHDALIPLWGFYLRHGRARDVVDFAEGCEGWAGTDPAGCEIFGASPIVPLLEASWIVLGRTNEASRIARLFGLDVRSGRDGVPDAADAARHLADARLVRESAYLAALAGVPAPTSRESAWRPENLARWREEVRRGIAEAAAAPSVPVPPVAPGTAPARSYPSIVRKPDGMPARFDGFFARRPVAAFDAWWIGWTRRAEERLASIDADR